VSIQLERSLFSVPVENVPPVESAPDVLDLLGLGGDAGGAPGVDVGKATIGDPAAVVEEPPPAPAPTERDGTRHLKKAAPAGRHKMTHPKKLGRQT
jgi:hypothetical protein